LLKAIVPDLARAAVIWDPSPGDTHVRTLKAIAPSFGVQLQIVEVRKPEDIDAAGSVFLGRPQALITLPSPMTFAEDARLVRLVSKHRLPATSPFPSFAAVGGMLAYGPDVTSVVQRGAGLVQVEPPALPGRQ
jgi:putative ABC transport system substrate-binding protein